MAEADAAQDIREVAHILASEDLDDAAAEEGVSEAMWLIKEPSAREELSGSLGIEVADACRDDDGYVRSLSLFLNALVLEVEAVSDTGGTAPTHTCKNLAKAVCHLIVRSATVDPTEVDMVQEAMDILAENLQDEYVLGSIVTEAFLTVARSPISHSNRGDYGPALILAFHMYKVAPPPVNADDQKGNSTREGPSDAFRRDVMDLFGRRVFVLGGSAKPATPEEVLLAAPLIMELTKEEFDGAILRPLKFKLMSSPQDTMGTLAAFVDVLGEADKGDYVDTHLGGGTNLVGVALNQIKTESGMVGAAKVMAALAKASPAKGAVAVTDAMAEELRDSVNSGDETSKIGLCLGLEAVARGLLSLADEGIEDEIWTELAEDVAIPALEDVGGYDGANSAAPWYELAGLDPPPPEEGADMGGALAGGAAAAAAAAAGTVADDTTATSGYDSRSPPSQEETDRIIKQAARGGPPASRPGAEQASALDDRIARKNAVGRGGGASVASSAAERSDNSRSRNENAKAAAAGLAVAGGAAAAGAAIASREQDRGAAANARASGGNAPRSRNGEIDLLDQRIAAKQSGVPFRSDPNPAVGDDEWRNGKQDKLGLDEKGFEIDERAPQQIASHGAAIVPEVEHGVDDRGMTNGGPSVDYGEFDNEEGLAVAVAVSPDEDEAFIPAAIEYDPDSKPPLLKNRRFRLYTCAAAILLVVAVAGVVVGVTMNTSKKGETELEYVDATPRPTASPTPQPTPAFYLDAVGDTIYNLVGDKMYDEGSPYALAADWIVNYDPMQLGPRDPNIAQRYLLSMLFFEWNGMDWTECTPTDDPNDIDCEATCYDWLFGDPFDCQKKRWLSNSHECEWLGVTCPEDKSVRGLELIYNNLNGTLPSEISQLESLQQLSLIENFIAGTIPSELGSMKHLFDIELNWNFLTGSIPEEIYDSRILFRLNVYKNQLTGTMSPNIGKIAALEGLHIGENILTGSIPTEIGLLTNLGYAQWNDNQLTGEIPSQIGNLRRLRQFYVDNNLISGMIPDEIGDCDLMEDLWIRGNNIDGWIPDQFYDLSNMWRFWGQDNQLSGTLSPQVRKLVAMEDFTVRGNFLSGTIPAQFANLQNLTALWLHFNDFTGTTSDAFCDQLDVSLEEFYTDCGATQPGNLAPYVNCPCCTHCCDHSSKCVEM